MCRVTLALLLATLGGQQLGVLGLLGEAIGLAPGAGNLHTNSVLGHGGEDGPAGLALDVEIDVTEDCPREAIHLQLGDLEGKLLLVVDRGLVGLKLNTEELHDILLSAADGSADMTEVLDDSVLATTALDLGSGEANLDHGHGTTLKPSGNAVAHLGEGQTVAITIEVGLSADNQTPACCRCREDACGPWRRNRSRPQAAE